MSVHKFKLLVQNGTIGAQDRKWFPVWLRRFAEYLRQGERTRLNLAREHAVGFCCELLANGTPAWQRLQAIRAPGAYRDMVLHNEHPQLSDLVRKLATIAGQERTFGDAERPDTRQERALVGRIDPEECVVHYETRRELRVRGKALLTKRAYIGWIERFMAFCGCDLQPHKPKEGL